MGSDFVALDDVAIDVGGEVESVSDVVAVEAFVFQLAVRFNLRCVLNSCRPPQSWPKQWAPASPR